MKKTLLAVALAGPAMAEVEPGVGGSPKSARMLKAAEEAYADYRNQPNQPAEEYGDSAYWKCMKRSSSLNQLGLVGTVRREAT